MKKTTLNEWIDFVIICALCFVVGVAMFKIQDQEATIKKLEQKIEQLEKDAKDCG